MADTRRYSLIDPAGIEASIAVTPSVFKRDYEPSGWTLGFATDGNREPYSDATLKALEKGAKKLAADGKARGIPTFIGPEVPTPAAFKEPEPAKAAAKSEAKAEA
jgi:hypothetical protein